jgi:hypothetical protein
MEDDEEEEVNQLNCHCLWSILLQKLVDSCCTASEEIPVLFMDPISYLPFT